MDDAFLDWALATFSGYVAADELYEPMVLVSDKPSNNISILQTKLCHREGYEARRVGL